MRITAFHSAQRPAVKVAGGAASMSGALDVNSNAVRVVNAGPNAARIRFSGPPGTAQPATTTDMLMLPNTTEVFTKGTATFVTVICDTGTAAMEFTDGEGL